MDYSSRNQKVTLARWKKIHESESRVIKNEAKSVLQKTAICGFLAGDGSVQVRKEKSFLHYQLDSFPDDDLMLTTYCNSIKRTYNKEPSIRTRDNVHHVSLTSRIVVEDLLQIARFDTTNWTLPRITKRSKAHAIYWLKAFFQLKHMWDTDPLRFKQLTLKE